MRERVIDLSDKQSPATGYIVRKTETGEESRRIEGEYLVIERTGYEEEHTPYYAENARVWLTERIIIPRRIPYTWVTSRISVFPDDDSGTPWDDVYDEWEHDVEYIPMGNCNWDNFRSRYGFTQPLEGAQRVITISDDRFDDEYAWARKRGASKQVAREFVADKKRARIDEIKDVYMEGVWAVEFDETIAGIQYQDAMYAIIGKAVDIQDPQKYPICDLAEYVIEALERDGFVVTGRPRPAITSKQERRKRKIDDIKYRLNLFNRST